MCNKKVLKKTMQKYVDDYQKKIYVCSLCIEYAERRAFRKI